MITAGGTRFAAGERVEYNDTNYLLLGYVLEKIYERSYDEIVQRQVAKKLGLARTYFAGSGSASTLESISYQATSDGWRAETNSDPSIDGGSRGMLSNATDLVTFIDGVFAAKLVTPYSLATMRDQTGGSGIGLWPLHDRGQQRARRARQHRSIQRLRVSLPREEDLDRVDEQRVACAHG